MITMIMIIITIILLHVYTDDSNTKILVGHAPRGRALASSPAPAFSLRFQ